MIKNIYYLAILIVLAACSTSSKLNTKWFNEKAPEFFSVVFETSKGEFTLKIERKNSPEAVDRFYQLVRHNYFDGNLFYRVNPGFVAQFGTNDSRVLNFWNTMKIKDEPVRQGNDKGTLSFARGGPNTRGTDLFINLSDNKRLDTLLYNDVKGFPTFGVVTGGMNVLENLYSGYADTTMENLQLMYENKKAFLELFPELDSIQKVYLKY